MPSLPLLPLFTHSNPHHPLLLPATMYFFEVGKKKGGGVGVLFYSAKRAGLEYRGEGVGSR